MKFSWLLSAMLGGGGVPANLDKAGIAVNDKVSGYECRVLLGKAITHHQDKSASQHDHDAASMQSPSSANTVTVGIDTLHIVIPPKNQTKPTQYIQRDAALEDPVPVITFKPTSDTTPPDTEQHPPPPTRQAEPPSPDYDADPDEASTRTPEGKETRNPASANQAIAGMSVGLVSVMLIFTVFL